MDQPGGFFNLSGGQFNPHLKTWALVFLAVSGIVAGGVLAQGALFHSSAANPAYHSAGNDPDVITPLWNAPDANTNGGDFLYNSRATYIGGSPGLVADVNANHVLCAVCSSMTIAGVTTSVAVEVLVFAIGIKQANGNLAAITSVSNSGGGISWIRRGNETFQGVSNTYSVIEYYGVSSSRLIAQAVTVSLSKSVATLGASLFSFSNFDPVNIWDLASANGIVGSIQNPSATSTTVSQNTVLLAFDADAGVGCNTQAGFTTGTNADPCSEFEIVTSTGTYAWGFTRASGTEVSLLTDVIRGLGPSMWTGNTALQLRPNGTATSGFANVLATVPFDPSSSSGKHFKFIFFWETQMSVSWPDSKDFFMYLTTNKTLATQSGYSPYTDSAVALIASVSRSGGGTVWNQITYVQKVSGQTIAAGDNGCNAGTDVICQTGIPNANYPAIPASNTVMQLSFYLNFTGSSTQRGNACVASGTFPQGGNGCNEIIGTQSGTLTANTGFGSQGLSGFQFQAQSYYVGFWADGAINAGISIGFDNNMGVGNAPLEIDPSQAGGFASHSVQASVAQILSTQVTISPTIDTGGFFGPVIRALIGIGVFIVQNLLGFAAYLWGFIQPAFTAIINLLIVGLAGFATIIVGVIKAILNAIGSGLGIPSLGDNLFTLFGDVSSFFTSFFGNALAQVSSFITFLNNGYSTVSASFGTYWTDLVNWTSGIKDLLGGIWVIAGIVFTIPFTFAFSGWTLYGAKKFSDSVGEGMEWFSLTRLGLLIGFNIALWLLTFLIRYVITPAMQAIMATGEAKKTAEPDIVIGGTGVG